VGPPTALAAIALLVKFNVGAAALLSLGLWVAVMLAGSQRSRLAWWSLPLSGVFVATFLGCFSIYGGPINAILEFLSGSVRLSTGYSAQMAKAGSRSELALAIVSVAVLAVSVAAAGFRDRRYVGLGVLLSASLFLTFKGGFVRHDPTHVLVLFATVPAIAALFLPPANTRSQKWLMSATCLVMLGAAGYARYGVLSFARQITSEAFFPAGNQYLFDATRWSEFRGGVEDLSRKLMAQQRIPTSLLASIGTGRIDAYPWEMSPLFANGLNWNPRPVPQSYSAYTPELDELNARLYRSPDGPEYILYHLDAIDTQHPWWVDPLTSRELYSRFDVIASGARFLVLKRRPIPRSVELKPTAAASVRLGERIRVPPDHGQLLSVALRFRLTAAGEFRDKTWKVYPPMLKLELVDGSTRIHTMVWRNAVSGLPISQLPVSRYEKTALWDPSKRIGVTAFTVEADAADFNKDVEMTWLQAESVNNDKP
jgi:hypothetical protein